MTFASVSVCPVQLLFPEGGSKVNIWNLFLQTIRLPKSVEVGPRSQRSAHSFPVENHYFCSQNAVPFPSVTNPTHDHQTQMAQPQRSAGLPWSVEMLHVVLAQQVRQRELLGETPAKSPAIPAPSLSICSVAS